MTEVLRAIDRSAQTNGRLLAFCRHARRRSVWLKGCWCLRRRQR